MFAEVALPLPLHRTFTYRLPADLAAGAAPGMRVLVPFGRRSRIGWIDSLHETSDLSRVRDIVRVLDEEPSVPPPLLRLCRWLADYYVAPLGVVLRTALPAALSSAAGPDTPAPRTRRVLHLTKELPTLGERDEVFGRAQRQRAAWELVESLGGAVELAHLTGRLGFSYSVINGLVEKGLGEMRDEEDPRDPYASIRTPEGPALTPSPAQREVIDELVRRARGEHPGTCLLRGVTGSGKTLVYIELLREVVERQGRTAIVLVPEIALTPQTVGRFKAVFGDRVAVLHSGLSDGERYDEWRALRSGAKRIVVGARSAVFAPLPDLGAVIVDEEHEGSYKQSESPRYHAREVAVVRARLEGAVCVLGSATPSLESWQNAETGKYALLELPDRIGGQPMPAIRVVDLRAERKRQREAVTPVPAEQAGVLSDALVDAVRDRLEKGEQTILLLNRRGYATFVQCRDCGHVWHCPQCNVSLTYHRRRVRLTCHYCLHEEPSPESCEQCGSRDLSFRGVGTEQVERAVGDTFPSARIARMDVDTTAGKWAHHQILDRVGRGEVDILLGTQMIAKGLDFPNVTLVGVVNADTGINLPDFRATERTFQLLTQVAGRAGRGPKGGEVLIQTSLPTHYAVACAAEHDFLGFAAKELEVRRSPLYPPFCRLVNVVVSATEESAAHEAAAAAADWLQGLSDAKEIQGVQIIGPAPCAIDRIRGRWRWHLILRSENAALLGRVTRFFAESFDAPAGKHDLRIAIDRDPVALL